MKKPEWTRRTFLAGSLPLAAGALMPRAHGAEKAPARVTGPAAQPPVAQPPSAPWNIACYTRPFDKHDYRVALDGIAEAGYRYAGLMTAKGTSWVLINTESTPEEVAEISHEVKQRDLHVVSIYGGDFPAHRSMEEGVAGLRTLIDHTAACACPELLLGGTKPELAGPYYKVVAECCAYAAEKKVRMTVKPHGGGNATSAQCRKLIQSVGHPAFRLWYDPGNIFYYSDGKLDPLDDAPDADGLVAGMCVKDFLPPKNVMVTPGDGHVDFPGVMKRLLQGGFTRGPLVVECVKQGDLKAVTAEARRARLFLEQLAVDLTP